MNKGKNVIQTEQAGNEYPILTTSKKRLVEKYKGTKIETRNNKFKFKAKGCYDELKEDLKKCVNLKKCTDPEKCEEMLDIIILPENLSKKPGKIIRKICYGKTYEWLIGRAGPNELMLSR